MFLHVHGHTSFRGTHIVDMPFIASLSLSQFGKTPLISSSEMGELEVVKELLAAGANTEAKDKVGGCLLEVI